MPKSRSRSKRRTKVSRRRSRSCPKGQILRKAYTRRSRSGSRVRVPATCIKDLGTIGHGEKLWTVKEGLLGKYGYHLHDLASKRHNALRKAVKNESYATVIRQLNAVRNYTHRSYPANSKKYGADIKWVQNNLKQYSLSSRSRSRRRSRR